MDFMKPALGALDLNVASWGLMNPGMVEIRFGKNATHEKARRTWGILPAESEQSAGVTAAANHQ
jgi:hypothetical protein